MDGRNSTSMARDTYPDAELKSRDFSSEKREEVAEIIQREWIDSDASLGTIADKFDIASTSTFNIVRSEYFGPVSHPVTFEQIRKMPEYEKVSEWVDDRDAGLITDDGYPTNRDFARNEDIDVTDVPDEIYDQIFEEGYREGQSDGREEGYQQGYMRYDKEVLEVLDSEDYTDLRRDISESDNIKSRGE